MREANQKASLFFAKPDANLKLALRQRSDGGRSSMVEPQIVVLVVAGSSPVGHPVFQGLKVKKSYIVTTASWLIYPRDPF
jgi:hypothetical protein